MGEERNLSRKQRIVVAVLSWLVAVPLTVGFFFLNVWVGLAIAVIVVFTTWDYIRKGDQAGHVERSYWGLG